jgi:glutathione S-transferase
VSLQLFGHPFSSYTQKVLIALYADETPFEYRMLDDEHPGNFEELKRHWHFGLFPFLLDDARPVIESTPIIEHLQAHHRGPNEWIPDGFFDIYVHNNMQKSGTDSLRPEGCGDPYGADRARQDLHKAYDWLEANLGDGPWAAGERFTLTDCAAAPSLFYADWIEEIGDKRPRLKAYRARLLAHPAVARCVDEGRPYRKYFPLGAPDRD